MKSRKENDTVAKIGYVVVLAVLAISIKRVVKKYKD